VPKRFIPEPGYCARCGCCSAVKTDNGCVGFCNERGRHPEDEPDSKKMIPAIVVAEMLVDYGASSSYLQPTWFKPMDVVEKYRLTELIKAMRQVEKRERSADVEVPEARSERV